ncbi:putative ribosomal protein L24e [Helianthus annuus]|uniref:Ribosomal protein L24e n=1 Tax=Helianthus annuus TaxID=4232 RepID=A0A251VKN8_HELAN|nr:putative ribosomal protein L24e [Helianthus annuus]
MVLKIELCRFSGQKIYPGRGIRFIRSDSQEYNVCGHSSNHTVCTMGTLFQYSD